MKYRKHFEKELEILYARADEDNLGKSEPNDLVIEDFIEDIYSIINKFSLQGHSGFSASMYANVLAETIKNALLFKPLSELTGEEDEWALLNHDIDTDDFKIKYQNKRLSSVFKEEGGKPYYLNAIVFQGPLEFDTFTSGNVDGISSKQYIRFPFIPKTFYIDVVPIDENNYKIVNRDQLLKVAEYYDMEGIDV